ncbi:MAG: sialate O-acetylesterase [Planctomycetota bacterium]|jgi:alpha-galactosidase
MMSSKSGSVAYLALGVCLLALGAGASNAEAKGPVKVFILAGQSNMEGKALASTFEPVIADAETREKFRHLKTDGKWSVRSDVWVTFLDKQIKGKSDIPLYGPLSVGFGGHKLARDENNKKYPALTVGPELGFGYVVGDHYDDQVLLVKAAWGGKSVKRDFRPPSAMPTDEQLKQELEQIRKKNPDLTLEELREAYGKYYRKMIEEVEKVLADIKKYFPNYDESRGYEIAGLVWFQGWNDGVGRGNPDYAEQMAHLIRDLRRDLKTPGLPVVIGELGTDGPDAQGWIATFRSQQAEVAAMPQFAGNVRLARTAQFWPKVPDMSEQWKEFRASARANEGKSKDDLTRIEPGLFFRKNWVRRYKRELAYTSDKRYHYLGSGACYYQMGEAMGKAMLEMVK